MEPPVLTFANGLPGFPHDRRFVLVEWGDDGGEFALLRSLDNTDLQFVVAVAHGLFPDYAPEIDDGAVEALGLRQAEDALLLAIVTVGEHVEDAIANLMAPIVVNIHTLAAAQVVLTDAPAADLRRPLWRQEVL